MKQDMRIYILLVGITILLSACAHETTTMDRELALKIVERTGRIEIVQSGGSPLLGPVGGQQPQQQATQGTEILNQNDGQSHVCRSQPIYSLEGQLLRTAVNCF